MPIGKAPLALKFAGGVELRMDPKQVPTTKLLDLQNGVFTKFTSIAKRNGHRALGDTDTGARGLAARVTPDGGEILRFNNSRAQSYRPSSDTWVDAGELAVTTATTLPIARTGSFQTQPDIAERNGIRVIAWEDSRGGVWCSVREASTGRILLSQFQLDSAALARNPRCVACGEVLQVLWTREDVGWIQIAIISPTSPTAPPVVSLLTPDLDPARPHYDAEGAAFAPTGAITNRPAIIVWNTPNGASSLMRVAYISPSGVLGSPVTSLPPVATLPDASVGALAITHDPRDNFVGLVWLSTTTLIRAKVLLGATLGLLVGYGSVATTGVGTYSRITAGWGAPVTEQILTLWWAAEVTAARTDLCAVDAGRINVISASVSAATRLHGHNLVSRAWHDGGDLSPLTTDGDVYAMVAHTVRFSPYVAALRLSSASGIASPASTIVARLLPGEAAGALMHSTGPATRAWTTHLPSVASIGVASGDAWSRQHAAPLPYRIQLSSQNGDQFSEQGIKLATLDFDVPYQTVQFGRGLYLASAAPMHYDGTAWREADFHCAPDLGYDAVGAPVDMANQLVTIFGVGAVSDGTRLYAIWYEAVDAQGEMHRGAVSVKFLAVMGGGPGKFQIKLPTCRLTRFANVRIGVARSVAGATGTDSTLPLYRVTSNDATVTTGDNRYVNNDPTVDTVTLLDNLTDLELITREPLYTNGGILNNDPSPWSGAVIAVAKNRLLWTDPTDGNLVRFTQPLADDTALEGPVALSLPVDAFGGPITAIAALDDAIVQFKQTAIFAFGGPGPLADPSVDPGSNIFTTAELLTSDVGCLAPASIGQTPLGITFQSSKGIMLLARGRQILDIGNPVEPLSTQTFTRTTLLPDRQAILYLTSTDDGFSLLWDYNRDQWSKFSNHVGLDAVVVGGVYHYLRANGRLYQETPGIYLDDTTPIPLRIETAWVHFAQHLQGWQKVLWALWLGEYKSSHDLSVKYRLDYNTSYSAPIIAGVNANFNPSLFGTGNLGDGNMNGAPDSGGQRYQRRMHINRRCQAISFLIEDLEAGGVIPATGASFELSELLLIGGGLGPDFKPGAARSG